MSAADLCAPAYLYYVAVTAACATGVLLGYALRYFTAGKR
jgi:hypothetical protein